VAAGKLGEMLEKIKPDYEYPTVGSKKGTYGNIPKKKHSLPPGITKKQSHGAQQLSKPPGVVAAVKQEARKEGRVPKSKDVYVKIKKKKQIQK
jgi:hypothetical protein